MVMLRCPCQQGPEVWGSYGGLGESTDGCSSTTTGAARPTPNRSSTAVRQAARAKGDGKSLVGLELGLRAYGRFLEGPVPRGGQCCGWRGVADGGRSRALPLGAYVVEALLPSMTA